MTDAEKIEAIKELFGKLGDPEFLSYNDLDVALNKIYDIVSPEVPDGQVP